MAQSLSEDELLALLDALADGGWHSGEDLAARSHITRAALSKRIEKLRDWQLEIESRHGLGYRLAAPLERLDAARIRKSLPRKLNLQVLAVTDSTNTRLLEAGGGADPQALLAEFQTGGRGRRGRQWISPFGANLYLSFAWSFAQWPAQLTALPLAVGVACARVLNASGAAAGIKWPNDLWVQRRKLGGILIEHRGETGGPCRVVIGIGLNVAMRAAQAGGIAQPWISLQEATGQAISRNDLAAALLTQLQASLAQFEQEGFAPFLADWQRYDLTANQRVRVEATEPWEGIACGIDASGGLIVESDGRRQIVHSGEVSLRLA